jgi:hypothetical protein
MSGNTRLFVAVDSLLDARPPSSLASALLVALVLLALQPRVPLTP